MKSCFDFVLHIQRYCHAYCILPTNITLLVCNVFLVVDSCEIKGCQSNVVLDGNFDNNRKCCMAKNSGFMMYDSLPGEITTGCICTPKLGERFCADHLKDHQELDKDKTGINLEAASKEFGATLGPTLRSNKKKRRGKSLGAGGRNNRKAMSERQELLQGQTLLILLKCHNQYNEL